MSQIRYLFVSDPEIGAPIENGEGIMVLDPEGANYADALISNEIHQSLVFAPEVNWYVKHTKAQPKEQKEVLKKLYEMRFIRHKYSPKESHNLVIGRSVMVIGDGEEVFAFVQKAEQLFDVVHILPSKLISLEGGFGSFKARFMKITEDEEKAEEIETECVCAQLLMFDFASEKCKQRGVECVKEPMDRDALLMRIRNRIGHYEYKNVILYESELCSYHHSEGSNCSVCVDICPSSGILKDDATKELLFSPLDCISCGKCVGVCPKGALDFAPFSQKAFAEVAKVCKDRKTLIVAEAELNKLDGIEIPDGYIPLVVETEHFISYPHLQVILEQGGQNILFYAPQTTKTFSSSVDVYQNKEKLQAFLTSTCKDIQTNLNEKQG
ncbi:MAG: 4Fe-4S dicluster domain-containing protein [Sulfurospirillaceae bacterium]|nr:4Fe-4S dicluster domain-containing protein [Sulfurospirillaceae bacterium]